MLQPSAAASPVAEDRLLRLKDQASRRSLWCTSVHGTALALTTGAGSPGPAAAASPTAAAAARREPLLMPLPEPARAATAVAAVAAMAATAAAAAAAVFTAEPDAGVAKPRGEGETDLFAPRWRGVEVLSERRKKEENNPSLIVDPKLTETARGGCLLRQK